MIIYLPRGPLAQDGSPETTSLTTLALAANATVVRLNYRLSKAYKYPTPIHDVLAGYDWVTKHLVNDISGNGVVETDRRQIGVCGELFGGSLASMLALTECPFHGTGIKAAIVGNPITDWTAMHPLPNAIRSSSSSTSTAITPKKKRATKPTSWVSFAYSSTVSATDLLKARSLYFRLPEYYFDHFASPLLFFRTPSSDIPPELDPLDELFANSDNLHVDFVKKRRSHRRYPTAFEILRLPDTMVCVGEENVLKDQGIELAESIARSNSLYGGRDGTGEGTGWERVGVQLQGGVGLWSEPDFAHIGSWLGEVLRNQQT